MIYVERTHDHDLPIPAASSPGAAGLDLRAAESCVLYSGERRLIGTGFKMGIPDNVVGMVKSRSGLSVKSRIDVKAGVIDSDYRGEVKVLLQNDGDRPFEVNKGDRIAQLIPIALDNGHQAVMEQELHDTDRGDNGFGSTGVS